ncbi:MAG: TlpA family protein disulfide reductase [Nannocystis sp.]|nr:TlpA disulfide reductase family protein [Nannocystis sp.]MBA3548081.1 TlpA family protein disulfide reductase [Nannocystis sp.]
MTVPSPEDEVDHLSPAQLRRVLWGGAIVSGLLVGAMVWSVSVAPQRMNQVMDEGTPLLASGEARRAELPSRAPEHPATPAPVRREAEVSPPSRLPGLLGLQLGYLRANEMFGTIAFGEVVRGTPAAKLVNLWATYCAPCVREIPMLRALSEGWRRDVRFVPIHVGEVQDRARYREFVDQMPIAAEEPLIDASGDAVQGLLRATGLLEPGEGIPITLLLDCRNELRWIHVGALENTVALTARLATLRGELGSPRCAPSEPAPVASTLPGCGDGSCEGPLETCATCPTDCGCTIVGQECRSILGEAPRCVFPESAFAKP